MSAGGGNGTDSARLALAAMRCRPGATRLTDADLFERLAQLAGWARAGDRIGKTFRFPDYYRTIAFVNAIATVAHREDHHPDLAVHYDRVDVAWSTHSAGGVTLNDCICAAKVDSLVG